MSIHAPSALSPRAFRPTWEVGASLGIHALVLAALFVGEALGHTSKPLFDPNQVMMVTAVALPKQTSKLPDRPTRTVDTPKAAEPSPTPPPPPTASDMVLHKPDAPKPAGAPDATPDRTQDRDELLRQMKKQQLLKDMSAAVADEDRTRTDPNGVDPKDAILNGLGPSHIDPELARYISKCRDAILPNWNALPATLSAHPDYQVFVEVEVHADGSIGTPTVAKGTGDSSFDRSALLAVVKTGRLPPPPEKYAASAANGVTITLTARDLK